MRPHTLSVLSHRHIPGTTEKLMRKNIFGLVSLLLVVSLITGCSSSSGSQSSKASSSSSSPALKLTVDAGDVARRNVPVVATLTDVKDAPPTGPAVLKSDNGKSAAIPSQVDNLGEGRISIRWIEPAMAPGEKKTYSLTSQPAAAASKKIFRFASGDGVRDLYLGDRPIMTQVIRWDPNDHANTFKPFDHVYSFKPATQPSTQPAEMRGPYRTITKGPGGLYTHHRGIFFGFNKTAYGDFWHCNKGESQRHAAFDTAHEWAGPLAAKMIATTDWVAADNQPKFRDTRETTVWRVGDNELVLDYDITLETITGKAEQVGGDAHHAGFHFRASNDLVDQTDKRHRQGAANYVFPAGAKLVKDDVWSGAPWANATFDLFGRRYSITHMDGPNNPDPTTYSTRPYGRFGAFFSGEVTPQKPLKVSYRLVIRDITGGATTQPEAGEVDAEYQSFTKPVSVQLAK
jgi:hypothetical protein